MRLATERFRKLTALAAGAAFATGLAPAIHGTTPDHTMTLDAVSVQGDLVGITLRNISDETLTGTVRVQACLAHGIAEASGPFVATGGQKIFVQFRMPSAVKGVIQVGTILDDGAPF